MTVKRGQVYWMNPVGTLMGKIQRGPRPVIIVSNDVCNKYSDVVHICPCTAAIKKPYPTHVFFMLKENKPTVALTEQIRTLNKFELGGYICTLNDSVMRMIDNALAIQFGLVGWEERAQKDADYKLRRGFYATSKAKAARDGK